MGLKPQSAKTLLMTDQNYSTPSESYFSYLNKRKKESASDLERERHVISNLGLERILPPYFNVETGKFEIQNVGMSLIDEIKEA